jgi:membrane fusion protein, multidrug efflux system
MTADYNGWQDAPEEEREALDALKTGTVIPSRCSGQALRREATKDLLDRSFASLRMTAIPGLRKMRQALRPAISAISATSAIFALSACSGGDAQQVAKPAVQPIAVRAAAVIDTTLSRPIVATGTVAPKDEIGLSFKVGGVIARVAVDPGDWVRAGQTLATLQLREIDAGLSKARSAAAKAERDLARAQRLYQDRAVSLEHFQDSETAAELARADLDAAAFNRRYAVIVAPSAGTVLRRSAEPGETVDPGRTVLVLGSQARGNVIEVGLADRDLVTIRRGDPAIARFDALPGKSFEGRVTQIDAAAEPGTGAYGVEITLRDAGSLVAGLVGRVEIHPGTGAPATLVPIEAVLEADGDEATVYALSSDSTRAERRRVKVAFISGRSVALAGGLEGSTTVLTDGAAYLDDGAAVEVAP